LNVALKTEHRDAGVAALERAVDPGSPDARDTLDNVVSRAKSKAIGKRARALIQQLDDAEAARKAAFESWQQNLARILATVEHIAAAPFMAGAASELTNAE